MTPVTLTRRQLEILKLVADGAVDKQIATKLNISASTVRGTLTSAYARCGAVNRAHAVAIAFREGWLC